MPSTPSPIGTLLTKAGHKLATETPEPIYGGYSNARGEISLFGESLTYRVDLKKKTIRPQAALNPEAQLRYNAAATGEAFEYCSVNFQRLSEPEITEICASGPFVVKPRFI